MSDSSAHGAQGAVVEPRGRPKEPGAIAGERFRRGLQVLNETGVRDPGRRSLVARDGVVLVPESVFVPGGVVA